MTRPLYDTSTDRRQAGHEKRLNRLERRQQIPEGGTQTWALYKGSVSVASPGAQTYIDLTSFAYGPASQTVFTRTLGTGPLSAIHGVGVTEFGVYRGWWDFEFSSYTNGDIIEAPQPDDLGINATWFFGGQQNNANPLRVTLGASFSSIRFAKMVFVGGNLYDPAPSLPRLHTPSVEAVGTSASFQVQCSIVIEQMGTDYGDNLISGDTP